jgi:hypothetical protein
MLNWVENGTAPTQVIATKWNNDTLEDGLSMQRPLCPYPQKAVYSGSGDWHEASTWACQNGELLNFPNVNGGLGTLPSISSNIADPPVCIDGTDDCFTMPTITGIASATTSAQSAATRLGKDLTGLAWSLVALVIFKHLL